MPLSTGRRPPPPGRSFRLVLLTTFATFCTLYAPQPLLPFFAERFGTTPATAALLMSVVFVPLAIAPLAYGAVLRRFSAQRLLVVATALLGALQIVCAAAPGFDALLTARAAQGLLFPAILTAAVTYCSGARGDTDGGARLATVGDVPTGGGTADTVSRRVATYVATTIVGGLSGRLIGGFASDAIGWRWTFALLGALLLVSALALRLAARDARLPAPGDGLAAARVLLATREFVAGFALIFVVFFAFSGCLNTLPFRLVELDPDIPPRQISLVYLGYLVGALIALHVERLTRLAGGPTRAMGAALGVFALGLALMLGAGPAALVATGFLTCAGMFTVHATLSGYLNGLRPDEASLVNGLYIALYYGAGALGSVLPLALYDAFGWTVFVAAMLLAALLAAVPLASLARGAVTA